MINARKYKVSNCRECPKFQSFQKKVKGKWVGMKYCHLSEIGDDQTAWTTGTSDGIQPWCPLPTYYSYD